MRIKNEIITSRQNSAVADAVKLLDRKQRADSGLFRFDGIKLLGEAVGSSVKPVRLLIRASSLDEVVSRTGCGALDCEALLLSDGVFEKISEEKSPEGVICVAKHLDNFGKIATINKSDAFFAPGERILLADAIRDPGNLGTIMRSAAALGCDRLIISGDCADPYNPKTLRASMGAAFRLFVDTADSMTGAVAALRRGGRRVFAAALDGGAARLGDFALLPSDCFVIGNEGHGIGEELISACDRKVFIPMREGNESLNAAAAAVIFLWEQARLTL